MGFWHRRRKEDGNMSDFNDQRTEEQSDDDAGDGEIVDIPVSGTGAGKNLDVEKLLRLQADFENFRRRNATARSEASAEARRQVLTGLLSIYDNFLRARDHASTAPIEAIPYLEGFDAIRLQLEQFLQDQGLEEIETPIGEPFDPQVHEATATVVAPDDTAEGTIAEIIRKGYTFKGTVLRPVTVLVYAR